MRLPATCPYSRQQVRRFRPFIIEYALSPGRRLDGIVDEPRLRRMHITDGSCNDCFGRTKRHCTFRRQCDGERSEILLASPIEGMSGVRLELREAEGWECFDLRVNITNQKNWMVGRFGPPSSSKSLCLRRKSGSELADDVPVRLIAEISPRLEIDVLADELHRTITHQDVHASHVHAAGSRVDSVAVLTAVKFLRIRADVAVAERSLRPEGVEPGESGLLIAARQFSARATRCVVAGVIGTDPMESDDPFSHSNRVRSSIGHISNLDLGVLSEQARRTRIQPRGRSNHAHVVRGRVSTIWCGAGHLDSVGVCPRS